MTYLKTLLLAGSVLAFTACGGGGGSSSSPAPVTTYDLRTYIDKSSFTMNLEGTINGASAFATFYTNYVGIVDIEGTPLDVHETTFVIAGVTEYSYTGTYLGNIYAIEGSARNCYIAPNVTPTPVPTNATIGYVSDVVPLQCDDGATAEVSFKLESAGGSNALVTATTKLYSNGGVLVSQSLSEVDPNMRLLSYEMNVGGNISLHSTSITQN